MRQGSRHDAIHDAAINLQRQVRAVLLGGGYRQHGDGLRDAATGLQGLKVRRAVVGPVAGRLGGGVGHGGAL